jgi:hypothetical protein
MSSLSLQIIYFFLLVGALYFFSRQTINEIFYLIRKWFKSEKLVFNLVSLIFLPGTIFHETAHFLTALILFLKVREIRIFPEWHNHYIKLGSVVYEKKDFVRGVMVGLAPFFFGLFFFWSLSAFRLFPGKDLLFNILFGYLIFAVSSTMFSSKQDLVDLIYLLPLLILIGVIVYIFNIQIDWSLVGDQFIANLSFFIGNVNYFFMFSLIINMVLLIIFKILRKIT